MRVLVHGDSLGSGLDRLRHAAAALEARGHAVFWAGTNTPRPSAAGLGEGVASVAGTRAITHARADIVIGGAPSIGRLAAIAWLTGAGTLVVGLPAGGRRRWSLVDRWFLGSVRYATILESSAAERADADVPESAVETQGWPSGESAAGPDPSHADAEHLERLCERLRSRRHGPAARPAAFLDRDGTLVVEKHHLSRAEDIELLPAVPVALRALQSAGFALVVISNQAGVGRGLFQRSSVIEAMAKLRLDLRRHGVELDGIYFCPHHPDEGCACRKPNPGMLKLAAAEHGLDLARSAMVGDTRKDVVAGQRAGALGILVLTGHGSGEAQQLGSSDLGPSPDRIARDLGEAADWLIGRDGAAVDRRRSNAAARAGKGWSLTPLG